MSLREKLSDFAQVLTLTLLLGLIAGAGLALVELSQFARLPSTVFYALPLLAGFFIGALTPQLGRSLGILLLVLLMSVLVSTLALTYPESQVARLGLDVALEFSIARAMQGLILTAPLMLVGLLIGKFLVRNEYS